MAVVHDETHLILESSFKSICHGGVIAHRQQEEWAILYHRIYLKRLPAPVHPTPLPESDTLIIGNPKSSVAC